MTVNGIGMTSQRTRDRLIQRLREADITDERVLEAIRLTPRHLFMDEAMATRAYEDTALPIGFGQTISQPLIVARMTEVLLASAPRRVLEVGTGSGYQTAVLARLVETVYSVERLQGLHIQAKQRLHRLQIHNAKLKLCDGFEGWAYHAPFDAIMVTAAPETVPQGLLTQLAEGGQMVIPIGKPHQQRLFTITRQGDDFQHHALEWVSFVPLLQGTE
jgi:protein-L-isoaspartate(D-aspartate) O-methyltransferase